MPISPESLAHLQRAAVPARLNADAREAPAAPLRRPPRALSPLGQQLARRAAIVPSDRCSAERSTGDFAATAGFEPQRACERDLKTVEPGVEVASPERDDADVAA
jgi:hypothetical protein